MCILHLSRNTMFKIGRSWGSIFERLGFCSTRFKGLGKFCSWKLGGFMTFVPELRV